MKVIISIKENDIDKLESIAKKLKDDGLVIKDLLPFGVITGSTKKENIKKLKKHPEIIELKEDKVHKIPPPDSKIQ